ncbi:MAG: HDOD domain-containing protein [Planctomycetota bacterium]
MSTLQESLIAPEGGKSPLPTAVLERLRLRVNHLKMLPAIAMQALNVANDAECGIEEFAAVIERDVTLAADILRMANSVMFAGGKQVMNLHRAVVRVGIRQCKNLIIASSFSSMMKKMSLEQEWIRECLWRHSFTTALLCLNLNRAIDAGFQGEEFVGGLVHDIGRALLATSCPEDFSRIDSMEFNEGPEILLEEQNAIESNHCDVGAWFAQHGSLPEPLIDVIRFHHNPERMPGDRRLVTLIAVCDHMANHLQRFDEVNGYDPGGNPGVELLEECGVSCAGRFFAEVARMIMESSRRDAAEMLHI